MNTEVTAREYVELLVACVGRCTSIDAGQRKQVRHRFDQTRRIWILARGFKTSSDVFQGDPDVGNPYGLIHGGQLKLEVRVRDGGTHREPATEVLAYRLSILDLSENANNLESLRFDKPAGQPRGDGWDDQLGDNPRHPWAHLHVNFAATEAANDFRLPTGAVCPILLLRSFDYWYCSTFGG